MKINTPEISWHAKEAIYSVDIQVKQENQPLRIATAGIDSNVRIWELKPETKTGVTFLSNLSRHEKAVNIVRFSRSGKVLASGGDDGTIVLWRLSDKNEAPNLFDDDSEIGKNVETWNAFKILRGHLEDINDLCWSFDENYMISGSIDQTAMLWDITKGTKMCILTEAKHFIHGVAFDPLGQYAAVISCDRSLRIYNIQSKKVLHNVSKMVYPEAKEVNDDMQIDGEENDTTVVKPQRMFHDETVVRRRLQFTCDGNLLIVPAGCLTKKQGDQTAQMNTAYIFTRGCLSKPAVVLPGFKHPVTVIRCCPMKFQLREDSTSAINLAYRIVFAVASSDTVLLYDTQRLEPFALIANIHYAAITDVTWSCDGCQLVVSSRDGFCSIIQFEENELGQIYTESESTSEEKTTEELCNGIENSADSKDSETSIEMPGDELQNDAEEISTENAGSCNENAEHNGTVEITKENDENMDTSCDAQKLEINDTAPTAVSSSQEKKPRRVPLTTVSDSPGAKTPRRVQLTTIASSKTDPGKDKCTPSKPPSQNTPNHSPQTVTTPKSASVTSKGTPTTNQEGLKKKTPRRIQLLPVND